MLGDTLRDMSHDQADFEIIGETPDLIAVNKPAGLLVHPTKPGGPRTLWDALKDLLGYEIANGGQVSLINRLDRETSGLVLVAKNAAAARRAIGRPVFGIRQNGMDPRPVFATSLPSPCVALRQSLH